jgi:uncharacterized membrane protein HdeD (DUF308 family)
MWDDITIQVMGLLFGLSLLVSGVTRTVLGAIGAELSPVYRVYNIVRGAIGMTLAVVCLRHVGGSAMVLAVLVGFGLIVDGVTALGFALSSEDRWIRRSGFAGAAAYALFGIAVLIWLLLSPSTFVLFGGACLVALGGTQMTAALRSARPHCDSDRPSGRRGPG